MKYILSILRLSSPVLSTTPATAPDLRVVRPAVGDQVFTPANTPFDRPPDIPRTTATELWEAFSTNEAAADRRYAHRPLYVAGPVERVARRGTGYAVELTVSGDWLGTVCCEVAGQSRFNVAELRRGQLALLLGQRVCHRAGRVVVEACLIIEDDLTALPEGGVR